MKKDKIDTEVGIFNKSKRICIYIQNNTNHTLKNLHELFCFLPYVITFMFHFLWLHYIVNPKFEVLSDFNTV